MTVSCRKLAISLESFIVTGHHVSQSYLPYLFRKEVGMEGRKGSEPKEMYGALDVSVTSLGCRNSRERERERERERQRDLM